MMPNLNALLGPPYIFLILEIVLFFLGLVETCTGEAWTRLGRVTYRAKEPKQLWRLIAMYLAGVCFIGYFLYKVYMLSNQAESPYRRNWSTLPAN
jgi:hypothetical protein